MKGISIALSFRKKATLHSFASRRKRRNETSDVCFAHLWWHVVSYGLLLYITSLSSTSPCSSCFKRIAFTLTGVHLCFYLLMCLFYRCSAGCVHIFWWSLSFKLLDLSLLISYRHLRTRKHTRTHTTQQVPYTLAVIPFLHPVPLT
jgi:hypothetical protein